MNRSGEPIRVLIVDDSSFVRDMIREILESEPGFVIVGEAGDGAEAVNKTAALKPDIVTMDIEMPVMGGLEAIERIIAECPVPILVVTAVTGVRTAFAAVSKGALEVIEKPDVSVENTKNLITKLRFLARVDIHGHLAMRKRLTEKPTGGGAPARIGRGRCELVAIASSTGGPMAIQTILARLPQSFAAPILITQHIAEGFTQGMVDWLKAVTPLSVKVAKHGDRLVAGTVYINPAEYSMRVAENGALTLGPKEARQIYHPSCNEMLVSVATSYKERALGLILSGMGEDGVVGMQAIKKAGGATLAQDSASSVVYGMNRAAVEKGCVEKILGLDDIPGELMRRVQSAG